MNVGKEKKEGGKTWLSFRERFKQTEMMTRKDSERINERINDDIDHNNGGNYLNYFNVCRWGKIFPFKACMKEGLV